MTHVYQCSFRENYLFQCSSHLILAAFYRINFAHQRIFRIIIHQINALKWLKSQSFINIYIFSQPYQKLMFMVNFGFNLKLRQQQFKRNILFGLLCDRCIQKLPSSALQFLAKPFQDFFAFPSNDEFHSCSSPIQPKIY